MKKTDHRSHHERWAYMRFSVVGQLLAAPPPKGELRAELRRATKAAAVVPCDTPRGNAGGASGRDNIKR